MKRGGGERVVCGEGLRRDDVAVLHVADEDLDAGARVRTKERRLSNSRLTLSRRPSSMRSATWALAGATGSHALRGCLRSLTATVRAEGPAGGTDLASTLTSACVGTRPSCWACAARPAVRAKARRRAGVSCLVMALD